MKKVLNIVLLFILGLTFISCDRMLKDPLLAGSGWGDVILNEANVTFADSISSSALNFTKAEVKIDGKTGTTGVAFKNVKSGNQTITITVPSADGKKIYSGSGTVAIKANEQITASVILNTEKNATNAYKIIFDPSAYGVTVVNEVHLVGNLTTPQWTPSDKSYALTKQADGKWVGIFDLESGKEFKFMYDATDWADNKHIGTDGTKDGPNFKVEETTGVIESVLAWKITFNPTTYGVTVINEVHLVGNLTTPQWTPSDKSYSLIKQSDNTWVGYFDIVADKEFKFMYDAIDWADNKHIGTDGTKDGPNFKVEEISGVITQNF